MGNNYYNYGFIITVIIGAIASAHPLRLSSPNQPMLMAPANARREARCSQS